MTDAKKQAELEAYNKIRDAASALLDAVKICRENDITEFREYPAELPDLLVIAIGLCQIDV